MLIHPTLDKLRALKLEGFARGLEEQSGNADLESLSFEERLGLLVDREMGDREQQRVGRRLRGAKLRQSSCLQDVDFRHPRGLDRSLVMALGTCQWIREHLNVLIVGATGTGKSYLACALAHRACMEGYTALYLRVPRLLGELATARGDGRHGPPQAGCAVWARSTSWSWTTGAWTAWTPKSARTCWRSWRTVTSSAPLSSPPSSRWRPGMRSSAIPRWPMRFSTAWSTTPTASH